MKIINNIRKSRFIRSSATLMSGSLLSQIITLLSSILLARIYSPSEMGVYTLVLTAESLFGGILCLRYDVAIVTEKKQENVYKLIKLCLILVFVLSLFFALCYGWFTFFTSKDLVKYTYLVVFIFIMLLAHGLTVILDAYNNRNQEYKLMTIAYVVRTCVQNAGAILLGFLSCGVTGLVGSHTLGSLFGIKQQSRKLMSERKKILCTSKKDMRKIIFNYKNLPIFSTPAIFANRYSYSSISLFINQLFGTSILGYYSISFKALGLPLTVLSNNISKVFFKDATKEFYDTGCFRQTFNKTIFLLICMTIPMGVVIYYGSPYFIDVLLGEKWLTAASYIRILLPMFLIRLIVNTIASGLQIVNKQKIELVYQVLLVFTSILVFVIIQYYKLSIQQYLLLINILFSLVYIIYFFTVMICAYKKNDKVSKNNVCR